MRAVGLHTEYVAQKGPLRNLLNLIDQLVRARKRSCTLHIRVQSQAKYRIQLQVSGGCSDLDVTKTVKRKTRLILLSSSALRDVDVLLPCDVWSARAASPRFLDLATDGTHRIERTVRVEQFTVAQNDTLTGLGFQIQTHPSRKVLAEVVYHRPGILSLHTHRLDLLIDTNGWKRRSLQRQR